MKKHLINGSLLVISFLLVLFLTEVISRLILNPANYLNTALVKDDILGHRIPDEAMGYDKWGFRNDFVPDSTDIVAIGDSQTFGINSTAGNNWPEQLQNMTNKSVYNLSLGGYGPAQYFHLFKTKALKLDPKQVIVGYYIGNDPVNAFDMVYNHKAWAKLRNPEFSDWLACAEDDTLTYYLTTNIFKEPTDKFLNDLRGWLAANSILYRLIFHGPIVTELKRKIDLIFKNGSRKAIYSNLRLPKKNISEGFQPVHRAFKMEISNNKVKEGLRLTLQFFEKMKEHCQQNNIKFTVLLIPTKEMVFCHYLFNNHKIRHSKAINNLLNNERIIREISIKYFLANKINFIDALPLMQQKIDDIKLYPPTYNDHPNDNGYHLMAKSIFNKMQATNIVVK